ncbi:MAG: substrate-binding domain-containing protein [Bdellovibrionota bacterium]
MPFFLGILLLVSVARAEGIALIVNVQNPMTSISRTQVADFFLKKNKNWPDGVPLRFFDRIDNSPERKIFLRDYIHKSSRDIELYWIGQKLYSGHSAPTQITTDSMVEIMVSKFPGALGYISERYELTRDVKKIPTTGL